MSSQPLDLSRLPPPQIVEPLDYEGILASLLADVRSGLPDFDAGLESDPAQKILESFAYRVLVEQQRGNDQARAVMLAYATGSNLEHLAALFGVTRQITDPGDPDARPPVAPTYETDERLRRRTQLAPAAISTAGPASSYRYHALSADPKVADVHIASPSAGNVTVTLLSTEENGVASAELIATVNTALSAEEVRPIGDRITVQSATITEYTVTAEITVGSGPDSELVRVASEERLRAYTLAAHKLGRDVGLDAIYAALHAEGVVKAELSAPTADIDVSDTEAAYATALEVTLA